MDFVISVFVSLIFSLIIAPILFFYICNALLLSLGHFTFLTSGFLTFVFGLWQALKILCGLTRLVFMLC